MQPTRDEFDKPFWSITEAKDAAAVRAVRCPCGGRLRISVQLTMSGGGGMVVECRKCGTSQHASFARHGPRLPWLGSLQPGEKLVLESDGED